MIVLEEARKLLAFLGKLISRSGRTGCSVRAVRIAAVYSAKAAAGVGMEREVAADSLVATLSAPRSIMLP